MTYKELLERVYKDIGHYAKDLNRKGSSITQNELIDWINKRHKELPSQYKGLQGVLQAAYDRADDVEIKNAIQTVFVDKQGKSLWNNLRPIKK